MEIGKISNKKMNKMGKSQDVHDRNEDSESIQNLAEMSVYL